MPDLICNTSPIQYLHQLNMLQLLPALATRVIVPPAVVEEIAVGRVAGVSLPDLDKLNWLTVSRPASELALPLVTDLGPGESEVLMLALEMRGAVPVLDHGLARRVAESLGLPLTGTLGILLDAKRAGLIGEIRPLLSRLEALRFRLSSQTKAAVLKLSGES